MKYLTLTALVAVALMTTACSRTFNGQMVGCNSVPANNGIVPDFYDYECYLPTYKEAFGMVYQTASNLMYGDCDDCSKTCSQKCCNLYNKRAKTTTQKGLACFPAGGLINLSRHAAVSFFTTDRGWVYFDGATGEDITSKYAFLYFL